MKKIVIVLATTLLLSNLAFAGGKVKKLLAAAATTSVRTMIGAQARNEAASTILKEYDAEELDDGDLKRLEIYLVLVIRAYSAETTEGARARVLLAAFFERFNMRLQERVGDERLTIEAIRNYLAEVIGDLNPQTDERNPGLLANAQTHLAHFLAGQEPEAKRARAGDAQEEQQHAAVRTTVVQMPPPMPNPDFTQVIAPVIIGLAAVTSKTAASKK
jgi:hypothetical protein